MGAVKTEIEEAIKALNLQQTDICLATDNTTLYLDLLNHFVNSGDRKWWWEDFKQESFHFIAYEFPFKQLIKIIPKTASTVWFMVEDDEEEYYPIYDCRPSIIGDIIGECVAFEYYVISKNMQWLICENHSDQLIGVGKELKAININSLK